MMKSTGKIIGTILIGSGLLICLAAGAWLAFAEGNTRGGALLGAILSLLIVAPLVGKLHRPR